MRYQSIMRNIACLFRVFAQSVGGLRTIGYNRDVYYHGISKI